MMPRPDKLTRTTAVEEASLENLREIEWNIDSPDPAKMYESVSELASYSANLCLLPKAMDLLTHKDKNVQHAAFTVAAKGAFGQYVVALFNAMRNLNPAEREQTLQSIQERFSKDGGPSSRTEQKLWVKQLEMLGREHQPTAFALMPSLGNVGTRWLTKQIRENTKSISLGAVPAIALFPQKQRKKLIRLLSEKAAKEKRELLPYVCGIVDRNTHGYLAAFMKGSSWQERVEIAGAIARNGITSTSGLVMQLVGDANWQVKQALLENIDIQESKISSVLRVLGYLVTETHSRVRSLAERTLLLLGLEKCKGSTLENQRSRLEKEFRPQVMKAASKNKDLDVKWLGIKNERPDPMSEILEKVTDDKTAKVREEEDEKPEGVSLSDLAKSEEGHTEPASSGDDKSVLLAALLDAKKSTDSAVSEIDPKQPASKRFLNMLQTLSKKQGKDVPMEQLVEHASSYELSQEDLFITMAELEKQGIIYRSGEGTVSYADWEM